MLWAETTEQTNSGWRAVEVSELMLGNSLPVAGRCRINWSRFEDAMKTMSVDERERRSSLRGGNTVGQRAVDDVTGYVVRHQYLDCLGENSRMASNPTDVGHASKFVPRVDIEDKLDCQCGTEQVATGGVDETLGLSSRSRSL